MAYKKLIKVSNVCQLLDKRKYISTTTNNGITFTNNGDGTITVNGTASSLAQYNLYGTLTFDLSVVKNHKYLFILTDITPNFYFVFGGAASGLGYYEVRNKYIFVTPSDTIDGKCYAIIRVANGKTCNNEIAKPQLFDLTEMYGAGNEPATVEEFRENFPNELYDYSPYCWLTSYKRVILTGDGNYLTTYQRNLTCKTKNLFDISKVNQSNSIQSNDKDIICSGYGSSIGLLKNLCPSLKVGDIVTLSLIVKSTTSVPPKFLVIQGQILYFSNPITITVTEDGLNSDFYLYNTTFENKDVPTTTVFTDIMIELGDTATDYVPYGYL